MAQFSSIVKAFVLVVVLAAVAGSAQEVGLAPAPSPDAGAGCSVPVSGVLIGTSLLFSLFASLRN
ncbi:hypothetical protein H5410_054026 [Solanum commersonii]|uniref:Uncharacterized protein n=1 Tax=Solanum commersonii TaxID=4109 RepID=A0A9J5X6N3_SOLCO|nr:hypothetical protein H5410_054026 [Solanum commersonii]KAH0723562.1 hypothetical protein KY289_006606 [Solanum tuberosum]KAH0752955.1 hypothetical protein KY285_006103 [Solanum tuberosum]